jgi:crotonobetainyl-CoA:carnitine CoA-transferase CaiB-like acyl-CoA transferase
VFPPEKKWFRALVSKRLFIAANLLRMEKPIALSGIKVLDMTRVLAGPWAGQALADLGAEVIKIEKPHIRGHGGGDDTRTWGPPFLQDAAGNDTADAAYYLAANRGKQSVTVDIAKPEGQAIIRKLAAGSDVLLENYKVGQLAKYGLDHASLLALNPRLIYCSITGFGQTGPLAHRAGYDFITQGMSGFMSITGERDDLPGGGPQKAGVAISDLFTGLYACIGVLAALEQRHRTGRGQHIDLGLLDVIVAALANMNTNYLASGVAPKRWGNAHPNIVPYQTFAVADGHIILAVGNDGQFRKFCEVAGRAELAQDVRFATNPQRVAHRAVLVPLLENVLLSRSKTMWIAQLEAAGVPCGPIDTIAEALHNPQVLARGMRVDLPHPTAGIVNLVGSPIKMSESATTASEHPPLLSEHTGSVLQSLGYSASEIATLRERGIV